MVRANHGFIANAETPMNQSRALAHGVPDITQHILGAVLAQMPECVVRNCLELICNLDGRIPWNVKKYSGHVVVAKIVLQERREVGRGQLDVGLVVTGVRSVGAVSGDQVHAMRSAEPTPR